MSDPAATPLTRAEKKRAIIEKVQKAVELEWATIPPYLTAYYSLRRDKNREPAGIIKSVFMEEMLHLVLAGNLLAALGSGARLGPLNTPVYPLRLEFHGKEFADRQFDIHLAAFSPETLDIFLQIELPEPRPPAGAGLLALTIEGYTIGQFYRGLQDDLCALAAEAGEAFVFDGPPAHQIPEDFYWGAGGGIIAIKDLATALAALELIIDQGEGTPGALDDPDGDYFSQPTEVAHYFRFNEIKEQRRYAAGDRPDRPPTGPALAVDYQAVYPVKPDCRAVDFQADPTLSQLNQRFNRTYTLMLQELQEAFNGNPPVLYSAIMDEMHGLADLATAIMQIPVPNDLLQRRAAPTFEWVAEDSPSLAPAPASVPASQGQAPAPAAPPGAAGLAAVAAGLAAFEANAERAYFDAAQDALDVAAYYAGVVWTAEAEPLYRLLSGRVRQTHAQQPHYNPTLELYPWVDLHPDRMIHAIYSGQTHAPDEFMRKDAEVNAARQRQLNEFVAARGLAFDALGQALEALERALPYNCEHSVPQSWFIKKEPMRGDLHHLFACESHCNSQRGNSPYFEFVPPGGGVPDCGRSEAAGFEPAGGKGAVARATLYFLLRYPGLIGDVQRELQASRLDLLLRWHGAFPPEEY